MTIQTNDEQEQWKECPEGDGSIFVSTLGRVAQIKFLKQNQRTVASKLSGKHYLCVSINGKKYAVHRLVLETFTPNPDPINLTQVNHKDENPENNVLSNLEWCSPEYNNNYGNHKSNVQKGMRKWMLKKAQERDELEKSQFDGKTESDLLVELLDDDTTPQKRQIIAKHLGVPYQEINTKLKRMFFRIPHDEALELIKSDNTESYMRRYLCHICGVNYQKFNTKVKRVESQAK